MRKSGQNLVGIVVLLLVIAVAIAFVIRASRSKPHQRPVVDWTCEECDHRFVAEAQRDTRACLECGGQAVRILYYYCSVHDHLFEAYRTKYDPDVSPMPLYKLPGGEWTEERPMEITCPEGNSDRKTLKYCPPGAEERQEKTE